MSAGKPAPRFAFVLDNSRKNPLDFNYVVFHMSSTLRPYVLVSVYNVLKKTHFCTWQLWASDFVLHSSDSPLLPALQLATVLLPLPVGY